MNALELTDRCIAKGPEEVFRELGFTRDGLAFRRTVAGVLDVAEFQIWHDDALGHARFVVNLGARHPAVHDILGDPAITNPSPGCCTVETRVNRGDERYDGWWKVTPGHEALVGGRVAAKLRLAVESWFTTANDLVSISALGKDKRELFHCPDSLSLAAIAISLGQLELGRRRIDQVVKELQAYRQQRVELFRKNDPFGRLVLAKAHFMSTGERTSQFEYNRLEWDQLRY